MTSGRTDYGAVESLPDPSKDKTSFLASCSINNSVPQAFTFEMDGKHRGHLKGDSLDKAHKIILDHADAAEGSSISCSHVTPVTTYKSEDWWLHRRMSRTCAPHYDPNKVTEFARYRCKYQGTGEINGKKVYSSPWQEWKGRIAICDGFKEGSLEIPDEVMEDVRSLVHYRADPQKEAKLDKEGFVCQVESIPMF